MKYDIVFKNGKYATEEIMQEAERVVLDVCREVADVCGLKNSRSIEVRFTNGESTWGSASGFFHSLPADYAGTIDGTLTLNVKLFSPTVDRFWLRNVVAHEVIHMTPSATGHGALWRSLAERMNGAGYKITRCTSASKMGIDVSYKYKVSCNHCGLSAFYKSKGRIVKRPEHYRCRRCGGDFSVKTL